VSTGLVTLVRERYRPALERALEWRYATLAGGIALLMITVAVVSSGRMKFSFFPPVDGDFVTARLTMPQGVPVTVTENAVL
jgi:multidrug efflux pump subunit AcrB